MKPHNEREREQHVPSVTRDDVVRIVRREFPHRDEADVLRILDQYGADDWHPEVHRVHLAILKLSGRSLKELCELVAAAKWDFRDVVAPAEYPEFLENGLLGDHGMSESEVKRIIDADWEQYCDWLNAR